MQISALQITDLATGVISQARWLSEDCDMFLSAAHEANEEFFQKVPSNTDYK